MRALVALLALLAPPLFTQDVPSPATFFGWDPGEDRRLLLWADLSAYYREVAARSPRIRLEVLGTTTEGRDLIGLVISERTEAALDEVRRTQRALALGELSPEALAAACQDQPAVVYVQGTLHSTEIGASVMFPHLVYALATADDPDTRRVLENVVVVLVPSANPDGQDLVVEWYRQTLDTPWEGSSPPFLYHRYAGHDDNRDWFMLSLKEVRIVSRLLYEAWFPEVVLDIHQMGGSGARMFVPPYSDPLNPNLPPLLVRLMNLAGDHMALGMTRAGLRGVVQGVVFDGWWHGGARSVPSRHNMIGILTETASARLASPRWLDPDELRGHGLGLPYYEARTNFPDPWVGGWWRLRDIVRYKQTSTLSLLDFVARHRAALVGDFHRMARDAMASGATTAPYAFLIPAQPRRPGAVERLVDNLVRTGIRVDRATRPFRSGGRSFDAGTYVVPMAQAFRAHAKDLLELQHYPELRMERDGDVIRPYDASGWSLPAQFGITCVAAPEPLPADLTTEPAADRPAPQAGFPQDAPHGLSLQPTSNLAYTLVNRALAAGLEVHEGPQGRFSFPPDPRLRDVAGGLGLRFDALTAEPEDDSHVLHRTKVGLLRTWPEPMDFGWTRLVLEEHGFAPRLVDVRHVASGALEDLDSLILPHVSADALRNGPGARLPPEYSGGLGREGVAALRRFVQDGGQLLALGQSTAFAIDVLDLPVKDVIAGAKTKPVIPGSLLRALASADATILPADTEEVVLYVSSPSALDAGKGARAELLWPASDVLVSGYLEGGERLAGLSPLVSVSAGSGRVLLYAFRPQHRSQTLGTFPLIFRPLLRHHP